MNSTYKKNETHNGMDTITHEMSRVPFNLRFIKITVSVKRDKTNTDNKVLDSRAAIFFKKDDVVVVGVARGVGRGDKKQGETKRNR
jgi:hypothetical protein